jgi:hypothetical protein
LLPKICCKVEHQGSQIKPTREARRQIELCGSYETTLWNHEANIERGAISRAAGKLATNLVGMRVHRRIACGTSF